ncbi:hypothetical protein TR51_25345 [Kitasatospora griseola]|uniref:Resolvase/invertase-type recombinase catalytic domain-containing protein n=1 Tax=Kitasatospora griseola TaxID=2064 RepID=A0A0D0PGD8_KITGR|nr:recombinase family protein [Kitasatospora griseola]KIQ61484.1 hypothetical protein TR51_35540 [Kitasatospora griseola]KIQ62394.1 hypothetical protein TR51_25345 [Kitasatospora griseola]
MSPILSPSVLPHQLDVVRVFLYARQSSARADGSEVSTESQLAAGHAVCAARSALGVPWVVVGEFADVGRSGWDPNVIRTDFEKMMTGVRAGEADVVIVNELSRLTRQGAQDALEIDSEFKKHAVRFMSILEPFLDTSTPIGVAIFALIAALAKQDSDIKAERLRGAKDTIAAVGGRHSSSPPYGMRAVREQVGDMVISVLEPDEDHPEHVETVLRMVELSFDGTSDNKIATTLDEEGIPAPGMSEKRATKKRMESIQARRVSGDADSPIRWRAQTVRWILNHPVIGGFASERVKRGAAYVNVIARDKATGKPLTPHRGIISGARWLELQEKRQAKAKPNRKSTTDTTPTLLSGWRFLGCGVCGGAMGQSAGEQGRTNLWVESYNCSNPKGHGGLSIRRDVLDDHVTRRVWARLQAADMDNENDREWLAAAALRYAAQNDLAGVAEEQRETKAHLDHVTRSIAELQADRKAGLYRGRDELATWRATMEQYRTYEDQCRARLAELAAAMAGRIEIPSEWFAELDPLDDGSPWANWGVIQRREFLSFFVDHVTVGRGKDPVTKKFIPTDERVEIHWTPALQEDEEENEEELAMV